jgi:hypothetical protein
MLCTLLYKSPKQEVITEYIIHGIAENAFDVGEKKKRVAEKKISQENSEDMLNYSMPCSCS